MGRIFLIGFMGSGKTTHGRLLAKNLKMEFLDLDEYIENKYSKSVTTLFEELGEEKFRAVEQVCLHEIPAFQNCLIATGGGTPCFFDNMDFMNQNGDTVYLRTSVKELADRLKQSKTKRPLLFGKSLEELELHIANMLQKREEFYLKSRYIVDTEDLTLKSLLSSLKELKEI